MRRRPIGVDLLLDPLPHALEGGLCDGFFSTSNDVAIKLATRLKERRKLLIKREVLLMLAPSIGSVYLIELLQTCTYGFLYPPLYYFVGQRIAPADTAKGQTMASSLYTLGTALGNSLGGTVIDAVSLNAMFILAACIAACGALLINATIAKADPHV